jgi:glycosyltransferase involved in cell wall biosynthesis
MQAGAAIVASNVDGIPEDCADGESALLVPPGDANALSQALERLLGDAELRRRLGGAARATFAARFSPDAFAAAIGALYAELEAETV